MNISASNLYSGASAYPVPVAHKTADNRSVDSELETRQLLIRDRVRESQNESRESAKYSRAEQHRAAASADQIRGRMASDVDLKQSTRQALQAYQSVEMQDRREMVTQTLGVDVYV